MKKAFGCLVIVLIGAGVVIGLALLWQWNEFRKARATNTVAAYQEFVTQNKSALQLAEAGDLAGALVDKGDQLVDWPGFLTALGESKNAKAIPVLAKYIRHPITEIRRASAAGLLKLAADFQDKTKEALGDLNQVAQQATQDSDPHVRLDLRCLLWQIGRADLVEKIIEPSPFVKNGFAAYQKEHAAGSK